MPLCDPKKQIEAIRNFNASAVTLKIMRLIAEKMRSDVFQPLQHRKQFFDFIDYIQSDNGTDFFKQEQDEIDGHTYNYTGRLSLKEHQTTEDDEQLKYDITPNQANTLILKHKKNKRKSSRVLQSAKQKRQRRSTQGNTTKQRPVHFVEDMNMQEIFKIINNRKIERYQPPPPDQQSMQDKMEELFIATIEKDILGFKLNQKDLQSFFTTHKCATKLNKITHKQPLSSFQLVDLFNQPTNTQTETPEKREEEVVAGDNPPQEIPPQGDVEMPELPTGLTNNSNDEQPRTRQGEEEGEGEGEEEFEDITDEVYEA